MENLKEGSVVRLKSGGPLLTVSYSYDSKINKTFKVQVIYADKHHIAHETQVSVFAIEFIR